MSNIPVSFEQQKQPSAKDYLAYLSRVLIRMWGQLAQTINGNLQMYYTVPGGSPIVGNIKGYVWTGAVNGPNAVVITHNLGYTPVGFITLKVTGVTLVYFVSANGSTMTVNSNAPDNNVVLLVV